MSETTSKVSSGGKGKATDPVPLPKDASTTVPAKPVDGQDDATKLEKKDGPAGKTKEGAEGLDDDDDEAPLEVSRLYSLFSHLYTMASHETSATSATS